jgi:hypothetical protein
VKGPSGRIQHRVQRGWRCPRCGKSVSGPGHVTALACPSCPVDEHGTPTWMVVEDPARKHPRPWPGDAPTPSPKATPEPGSDHVGQ